MNERGNQRTLSSVFAGAASALRASILPGSFCLEVAPGTAHLSLRQIVNFDKTDSRFVIRPPKDCRVGAPLKDA